MGFFTSAEDLKAMSKNRSFDAETRKRLKVAAKREFVAEKERAIKRQEWAENAREFFSDLGHEAGRVFVQEGTRIGTEKLAKKIFKI